MANFKWTQSALKDFERDSTCPSRWKGMWVDKQFRFPTTEAQLKGLFFEQLCIGNSAHDSDSVTLALTAGGKKTADQLRIERQAEVFKQLFNPNSDTFLGLTITDTQVKFTVDDEEGTIDIQAKDAEDNIWFLDLKLSADIKNTYSEYSWARPVNELDLIQLIHYRHLGRKVLGVDNIRLGLLLFDYTPDMNYDLWELNITDKKEIERNIRFSTAKQIYNLYENEGWTVLPSKKECSTCPLQCELRFKNPTQFKTIIY